MKKNYIEIKEVIDNESKKQIIKSILYDLPDWFGIPESTEEYILEGSQLPTFAAYIENEGIGFITVKRTNENELELFVLGIKRKYHRLGIGKKLFESVIEFAKENKYREIRVMTVDESFKPFNEPYDNTRKFYYSLGFKKIKVDNEIWGSSCPCLIMKYTI